jgi:TatD DNase family protein
MQLIDTHCHLTFEQFGDVAAVMERAGAAGVGRCITVGTTLEDSGKAVELAARYEHIYATVAVHPHEARVVTDEAIGELKRMAANHKVVAIGETGLDFHYNFSTPQQQRKAFEMHLRLAEELELPVIIHSREAFDETMAILKGFENLRGVVFHCFSGSAQQAKIVLDAGYFLSFTGVVTFKSAEKTREAVKTAPVGRLMLETDAPYMSPEPMRKQKVNEPALVMHTARFLADLRNISIERLDQITTANTEAFFKWPVQSS